MKRESGGNPEQPERLSPLSPPRDGKASGRQSESEDLPLRYCFTAFEDWSQELDKNETGYFIIIGSWLLAHAGERQGARVFDFRQDAGHPRGTVTLHHHPGGRDRTGGKFRRGGELQAAPPCRPARPHRHAGGLPASHTHRGRQRGTAVGLCAAGRHHPPPGSDRARQKPGATIEGRHVPGQHP